MSTLRDQFETRAGRIGASIASLAELETMLTGAVFVSEHPICARWARFANRQDVRDAEITVTGCDLLIADTASAVVLSGAIESRLSTLAAPIHVIVATEDQLVPNMEAAFDRLADRLRPGVAPANMTVITGASRTTDIEKTLVCGVHGPRKLVFVFLISDDQALGNYPTLPDISRR